MAGNKTIGENYSFSGVHHIFDQHKAAGSDLTVGFLIILASLLEVTFNRGAPIMLWPIISQPIIGAK